MRILGPFSRTDVLYEECLAVRFAVFSDEQGFARHIEIDEYDHIDETLYFALYSDTSDKVVGTIRMVIIDKDVVMPSTELHLQASTLSSDQVRAGKLGRLAVLKEYRGVGGGRMLMEALMKEACLEKYGVQAIVVSTVLLI